MEMTKLKSKGLISPRRETFKAEGEDTIEINDREKQRSEKFLNLNEKKSNQKNRDDRNDDGDGDDENNGKDDVDEEGRRDRSPREFSKQNQPFLNPSSSSNFNNKNNEDEDYERRRRSIEQDPNQNQLMMTHTTTTNNNSNNRKFPTWLIISIWITLSSIVIFYNSYILNELSFSFPVTLTALHLFFQTIITQVLVRFQNYRLRKNRTRGYQPLSLSLENGNIINNNSNNCNGGGGVSNCDLEGGGGVNEGSMTGIGLIGSTNLLRKMMFWKKILPISILFSASLVLSNAVYLYLSVSFIQMIKAASPVAVLLTAIGFGLQSPSIYLFMIVFLISFGIGIASYGEVKFNLIGFLIQIVAILVEANRVVLIQLLLGTGISPLTSLYFFAPVCLVINLSLILPLEGFIALKSISSLGPWIIISNSVLTFLLNLSSVYLIQVSSLVLSLSKVLKDLILIIGSNQLLLILKKDSYKSINLIQWIGYFIALIGLVLYKRGI